MQGEGTTLGSNQGPILEVLRKPVMKLDLLYANMY